jgi:hypothetical protein
MKNRNVTIERAALLVEVAVPTEPGSFELIVTIV